MLTLFSLWGHSRLKHGWLRALSVAFQGRLLLGLIPLTLYEFKLPNK